MYDFTLAADPAYPDTSVEAREFTKDLREVESPIPEEPKPDNEKMRKQLREMRRAAAQKIDII